MGRRYLCREPVQIRPTFHRSRHAPRISQSDVVEDFNFSKSHADPPEPLASQSDFNFVPLFGLGLGYVLIEGQQIVPAPPVAGEKGSETKNPLAPVITTGGPPRVELYGTVSQAYRPITYGELVPTGASSVVNGNLKEGEALQFEYGIRGKPLPYLNFDVGGFYFTFDDQIGEIILPERFYFHRQRRRRALHRI